MSKSKAKGGAGGMFYFLGVIGAAVYYIKAACTFWAGVVGVIKAIVWPAVLVYQALEHLVGPVS